ncbi:MAG: cupredoxin domain-containing protein [Blastocatellia bacterium]
MRKIVITILTTTLALAVMAAIVDARARTVKRVKNMAASAEKATVKVSSFKFEPKILTVTAGTTVEWVNEGGRHTVESDNGAFKSDVLTDGKTFEHTFDKPGTYAYHCSFHGESGGKDMAGKIVVRAKK